MAIIGKAGSVNIHPPALCDMYLLRLQSGCGVDEYFDRSFGSQDEHGLCPGCRLPPAAALRAARDEGIEGCGGYGHDKLASWVSLCPGDNISARKRKHGHTGDVGPKSSRS